MFPKVIKLSFEVCECKPLPVAYAYTVRDSTITRLVKASSAVVMTVISPMRPLVLMVAVTQKKLTRYCFQTLTSSVVPGPYPPSASGSWGMKGL